MMVDAYALQHPERYCVSAKSLAAHLTGLCWAVEHAGNRAIESKPLRRWLNGTPRIEKPVLPAVRGSLTIEDVREPVDPASHAAAVERWARATWDAYSDLHALARRWIREAFTVR
jgi:hypothetical protein